MNHMTEVPEAVLIQFQCPDAKECEGLRAMTTELRREIQLTRTIDYERISHADKVFIGDSVMRFGDNGLVLPSVALFGMSGARCHHGKSMIPFIVKCMPNLKEVYVFLGLNDIMNCEKYGDVSSIPSSAFDRIADYTVNELKGFNKRSFWDQKNAHITKLIIMIPWYRSVPPHASETAKKSATTLNAIIAKVGIKMLRENDSNNDEKFARVIQDEFRYHAMADGIHIKGSEVCMAIAVMEDAINDVENIREPIQRCINEVTFSRIAIHQTFLLNRLQQVIFEERLSNVTSFKTRNSMINEQNSKERLLNSRMQLRKRPEMNTELPLESAKLCNPNKDLQKEFDKKSYVYTDEIRRNVKFEVIPLKGEVNDLAATMMEAVKYLSLKSEYVLYHAWGKKLLDLQTAGPTKYMPRLTVLLSILRNDSRWKAYEDKAGSSGAQKNILDTLKFGDLIACIMVLGAHEFNKGPLDWRWNLEEPRLNTFVFLVGRDSVKKLVDFSATPIQRKKNEQSMTISTFLKLEELRNRIQKHVRYYLFELRNDETMGIIDLCLYLGVHEKLLMFFMTPEFITTRVGYHGNSLKHPLLEWYQDNRYILHPGSHALGTVFAGPMTARLQTPMREVPLKWVGGQCTTQNATIETLKQDSFLESISGKPVAEHISLIGSTHDSETFDLYHQKKCREQGRAGKLIKLRMLTEKRLREEQEQIQIAQKAAEVEQAREDYIHLIRMEAMDEEMSRLTAQDQEEIVGDDPFENTETIPNAQDPLGLRSGSEDENDNAETDILMEAIMIDDAYIEDDVIPRETPNPPEERQYQQVSARKLKKRERQSRKVLGGIASEENSQEEDIEIDTPPAELQVEISSVLVNPNDETRVARRVKKVKQVVIANNPVGLFDKIDPDVTAISTGKRMRPRETTLSMEETITVSKKADVRKTPPGQFVASSSSQEVSARTSTSSFVTSTPIPSKAPKMAGPMQTKVIPTEDDDFQSIINRKRAEDVAAGLLPEYIPWGAAFSEALKTGKPSIYANAVPAGEEVHVGGGQGSSSGTNKAASNTNGAYAKWRLEFIASRQEETTQFNVLSLGHHPDGVFRAHYAFYCTLCDGITSGVDHACPCDNQNGSEMKMVIRSFMTNDYIQTRYLLTTIEKSFSSQARKLMLMMDSQTLLELADHNKRYVIAFDTEWMSISFPTYTKENYQVRLEKITRDIAKENKVELNELQRGFECITQLGACIREDVLINPNDWEESEQVRTKNAFFMNQDFSVPRWATIRLATGAGMGVISKVLPFLDNIDKRSDREAFTGMNRKEWKRFYEKAINATYAAKDMVRQKSNNIVHRRATEREWVGYEKFLQEGMYEPAFMKTQKRDILGPGGSSSYRKAISPQNPCAGTARKSIKIAIARMRNEKGERPYTLISFAGEGDVKVLALCPEGCDAILDIQDLLSFRYKYSQLKNLSREERKKDLPCDSEKFTSLTIEWQNPKLVQAFEVICNPDDKILAEMQEGAHDAYVDAMMTMQIFYECMEYQREHAEVFDRYGSVYMTAVAYTKMLRERVDDLDAPMGSKQSSANMRRAHVQMRQSALCDKLCTHK